MDDNGAEEAGAKGSRFAIATASLPCGSATAPHVGAPGTKVFSGSSRFSERKAIRETAIKRRV